MTREEVYERLNAVFADVFDDPELTVNDETTAADVDGWDSLVHITLIDAVEEELAEVLNYCLQLASKLNMDPAEIIRKKIKKNALKYPVEKSKGRSDKYDQL